MASSNDLTSKAPSADGTTSVTAAPRGRPAKATASMPKTSAGPGGALKGTCHPKLFYSMTPPTSQVLLVFIYKLT
jgi:hypothetical protein